MKDPLTIDRLTAVDKRWLRQTSLFAFLVLTCFLVIWFLSPPFRYASGMAQPTLAVTGLLMLSAIFAFWGLMAAIKVSVQVASQHQLLILIIGFAISTRLVALFTCPILEIDYYRYLWDGKVIAQGISPYQYAPEQILLASPHTNGELGKLNLLALASESNHLILSRIHFANHTTIYPPVSQLVFGATMSLVPFSSSVETHIAAMKLALVLFDLGTLSLVLLLFRLLKLHCGWLIVYAWNPLVIKEVANGGHLDSIATFLTVLSVLAMANWYLSSRRRHWLVIASAVALGLGVGAKLFPIVLFPLLLVATLRKGSSAYKGDALAFSIAFTIVTTVVLSPMLLPIAFEQTSSVGKAEAIENVERVELEVQSKDGLTSFLSSWRMNDMVFSTIYLNLKDVKRPNHRTPWFVITSEDFRSDFCNGCKTHEIGGDNPAYSATRAVTLGLFSIFYIWHLAALLKTQTENEQWIVKSLSRIGWILAVFLILQPTVNPWYMLWATPFFCFSKNHAWLLIAGVMLTYYSRFWFKSIPGPFALGGTNYSGVEIYDFFVVWGAFTSAVLLLGFAARTDKQKN